MNEPDQRKRILDFMKQFTYFGTLKFSLKQPKIFNDRDQDAICDIIA